MTTTTATTRITDAEYGPETIAPLPVGLTTKTHQGDPCVHCGTPHDEVAPGPCPGTPSAVIPPTPASIDAVIASYEHARKLAKLATDEADEKKQQLITLVERFGYAPAHAEQSRRINGALNTATVTTGTNVTVNETKVQELTAFCLKKLGNYTFAAKLFLPRVKHELVAGGDETIKTATLSERTRLTLQSLYGQCFTVKAQSPKVKVELLKKEPKATKPRSKKYQLEGEDGQQAKPIERARQRAEKGGA